MRRPRNVTRLLRLAQINAYWRAEEQHGHDLGLFSHDTEDSMVACCLRCGALVGIDVEQADQSPYGHGIEHDCQKRRKVA